MIGRVASGKGEREREAKDGGREGEGARERGTDTRIQIRRVGGRCGKSAVLRGRSSRQRDRDGDREREKERRKRERVTEYNIGPTPGLDLGAGVLAIFAIHPDPCLPVARRSGVPSEQHQGRFARREVSSEG